MRAFFRRHRGLHIWLLSVCGVLALYFALRTVPGLMTRCSRGIIMPLERAVAAVCYRADFSVAELLYAIVAGVVLLWMGAIANGGRAAEPYLMEEVDSKKLVIDEPIKSFGSYQVKAKLGFEISGIVNVLVIEEK